MLWTPDLKIAKRTMRTALNVVSANLPGALSAQRRFVKGLESPDTGAFRPASFAAANAGQRDEVTKFGSNPGQLRMLTYGPTGGARENAPLVVVLHGCGQGGAEFAQGTGWIALADELGFTVVMPEQNGRNNQGRCFQWFQPGQTARGVGEALSVYQMIESATKRFVADPQRVFVVGLSAGGAMAAALLAAYPDVFAGGAVVAGLPVGAASGTMQAMMRMAHAGPDRTTAQWAEQVRGAAPASYRRGWPRISIWHGAADTVVDPANADLLAIQWGAVLGLHATPSSDITEASARHCSWGKGGETVMEQWTIPGMAHGYPIDLKSGKAAPFIIDVGISATRHIAQFWDCTDNRYVA